MSTRVMQGIVDLTGRQVNTLRVGDMISRHPRPRYRTTCQQCGAQSTEGQDRLGNGSARCLSVSCGKPASKQRDRLDEERRNAAERENARRAEDIAASARRMAFETEDYQRPERYAPTPTKHVIMTERERIELRQHREAEEAEQRRLDAPRLEAERIAAIETAETQRLNQVRQDKQKSYWREWVLSDRDPKLIVTPKMSNASMPKSAADKFNGEQVEIFIRENPDYLAYKSRETSDAILSYFDRNGVYIVDAAMFKAAFHRLRDLGIITMRSVPVPPVLPVPQQKRVNLSIAESPKPKDERIDGWDLISGEPRKWTPRELDKLSADDYRRALRLYKSDLELPHVGPGPVLTN